MPCIAGGGGGDGAGAGGGFGLFMSNPSFGVLNHGKRFRKLELLAERPGQMIGAVGTTGAVTVTVVSSARSASPPSSSASKISARAGPKSPPRLGRPYAFASVNEGSVAVVSTGSPPAAGAVYALSVSDVSSMSLMFSLQ